MADRNHSFVAILFQLSQVVCLWLIAAGTTEVAANTSREELDFFERRVRPVLVEHCFECHSSDTPESELQLDSLAGMLTGGIRGPSIVVSKPDESLLVRAIRHGEILKMPPKTKLSPTQIADIAAWIEMGAPWPDSEPIPADISTSRGAEASFSEEQFAFWSLQKPVRPVTPGVQHGPWIRTPIDAFILHRLEAAGFSPAPPASRRTLIRRATFDLTGLPPTPEEIQTFLTDQRKGAFARVVERLLASPRYGERWGRHWLDVARYADSNGLDENLAYGNAFQYRDYVVAAFNNDKPFDRFVHEQIAGDLLPEFANTVARLEAMVATGFLSLGAKMLAEDDPVKMQMDIIDEQIDTIGRAFIGLSLGCARCHDHKFDPVSTADYYGLAGIFKSTKTMDHFNVVARWQERPLASPEEVGVFESQKQQISTNQSEIETLQNTAAEEVLQDARQHVGQYLLATCQLEPADGLLGNDHQPKAEFVQAWSDYLQRTSHDESSPFAAWNTVVSEPDPSMLSDYVKGVLDELDFPRSSFAATDETETGRLLHDLAQRYQDRCVQIVSQGETTKDNAFNKALATVLNDPDGPFKVPETIDKYYSEKIAAELTALKTKQESLEKALPQIPHAMAVSEGPVEDVRIHIRGNHLTLGRTVARQLPAGLQLANGHTIDKQRSGRLELASWLTHSDQPLTARVMANRIWLWHFGEGLVRSPDNFGQLGERPTHPGLLDWLAVQFVESGWSIKQMHRLLMLSSTYQMSTAWNEQAALSDPDNFLYWRFNRRRLEAESIRDALLAASAQLDFSTGGSLLPTENRAYVTGTASVNPVAYQSKRRSIYLPIVRSALYDMFQVFDFADPSVMHGQRQSTTVAPQALFMMNSQFVSEQTLALADRLLGLQDLEDRDRVAVAYERTVGRSPKEAEVSRNLQFIERYQNATTSSGIGTAEARRRAWQSLCRAIVSTNEFVYTE